MSDDIRALIRVNLIVLNVQYRSCDILMTKRTLDKVTYSLPSGIVKVGEGLYNTAFRVAKYNLGLNIDRYMLRVKQVMLHKDRFDTFIEYFFIIDNKDFHLGNARNDVLEWCDIYRLPESTDPYAKDGIKAYLNRDIFNEYTYL